MKTYELHVSDADDVKVGHAKVETRDEFLALHVSHALVGLLGPHSLTLDGEVFVVDGSKSTGELEQAQLIRMNARLVAGQRELEDMLEKLRKQEGL